MLINHNSCGLTGVWKLISFEIRSSGSMSVYPFGEKPKGLLIYTKGGYMSGKLMPSDRSLFASEDPLKGSPSEIEEAFESFIGYYGRYEVDTEKHIVEHYVEGSMFPNWTDRTQARYFELNNNLLTLKTPPIPFGKEQSTGVLVWSRVE